jgi:hypothetical protein
MAGPMLTSMVDGDDDPLWDAFFNAMLAAGSAEERRSRYGQSPPCSCAPGKSPIAQRRELLIFE